MHADLLKRLKLMERKPMIRDRSSILILLLLTMSLVGCSKSQWVTSGPVDSPTDGLSMDLFLEGSAQKLVRYRFNGTGTLWFAGGVAVTNDKASWEGRLNPEQGRAIVAAVRKGRWFTNPPSGDGSESETWTIHAWSRDNLTASFKVYGKADSVQEVYDILNKASSARFDEFLSTMPKPSLDQQMDLRNATMVGEDPGVAGETGDLE